MKLISSKTIVFIFSLLIGIVSNSKAQSGSLWQDVDAKRINLKGKRQIVPQKHRTLSLDLATLKVKLAFAPMESVQNKRKGSFVLDFPMPDGGMEQFRVVESPIMDPVLAAKFPAIKTYLAQGIDNPYATMRFDVTHKGLHAMISSPNGTTFIDPYSSLDVENYIVYYKKDFTTSKSFNCLVEEELSPKTSNKENTKVLNTLSNGETLRTYRLAVAATGEYTQYHGGTVADGQAAIVTTFNRLNQVYENELSVRLVLVANNDQLIYTNGATDPFNNFNASVLIGESQTEIDNTIGDANYDVGHTVSTGGGGLAGLGVPCRSSGKARGITGSAAPIGDPYDIDYVCHEVGHQFGGSHTFNGSSGSCSSNSSDHGYEPGSGTTIQAYAGICSPQNIQNNSDPYFHIESLNQMISYSTLSFGDACAQKTQTGNTPPVATIPMAANKTIPASTPFELTAAGTDVDNDALTYCWEQFDLGPQGAPEAAAGNAPLFRSRLPSTSPIRTFPRLNELINNTTTYGEMLPAYTRNLNFRMTLRDNRAGGGGVHCAAYAVDVDGNSGPFLVTAPNNSGETWAIGDMERVTWDVANTTAAPVSCANVDILLSIDGGFTYPTTIATAVPNVGTYNITVPNHPTTTARIKVICSDNIFFDISNNNLEIQATGPDFSLLGTPSEETVCSSNDAVYTINVTGYGGYTDDVTLSATGLPTNATASFSPTTVTSSGTATMTLTTTNVAAGNYTITVNGSGSVGERSTTVSLTVLESVSGDFLLSGPVDGGRDIMVRPTFSWDAATAASSYMVEVATELDFATIVASELGLTTTSHTFDTPLTANMVYYWRVRAANACGVNDSPIGVFMTENSACTSNASTNVPITIATVSSTVTSTLDIPANGTIVDLNVVNLNGTHSWINDLDFNLTSPTGTTIQFMNQRCNNEDNFDLNFDDEAAAGTWPCPPVGGGTYQPFAALSAFDGEDMNGTWTLTINDCCNGDGGELQGWGLEICYTNPSDNPTPLSIPLAVGTYIADLEYTDGTGWTHYYKSAAATPATPTDVLLLSIEKDGVVAIAPAEVTLGVTGQGGAVDLKSAEYVTNRKGWFVMNRYWDINPTTQPGPAGLNVRFYYSTADYEGMQNAGAGIDVTVANHDDLAFYKFASGAAVNPDPTAGHIGGDTLNYVELFGTYTPFYTQHYTEFEVTGFSGGGGGIGGGDNNGPLPIELLSFTGEITERGNLLKWATANEWNNDYFSVQQSLDAINFKDLGRIAGAGNSNSINKYEFLHRFPEKGNTFYRLKQVDFDGSAHYSNIINIKREKGFEFELIPNPVQDKLTMYYEGVESRAKIWVYDLSGRQLYYEEIEIEIGANVLSIPVQDYPAGMYILEADDGDWSLTKRFIVR